MLNGVKGNITKVYLFELFGSFILFAPVLVLFFQENGLTMTEIMVLQSAYSISVILLEIPTGYFADYYGRKPAMIIASTFLVLGVSIYSAGYDFWTFLIGELIWSIGVSFYHGTDSALFYDTLTEIGRQEEYQKLWGKASSYSFISAAAASIIGGLIAEYSLRLTLQGMILVLLPLIPLSLTIKEPKHHREVTEDHVSEIKKTIKLVFFEKNDLRFLIFYSAIIVTFTSAAYWIYQPYFEVSGLDLAYFGIVFAGFNVVSALVSRKAHLIEDILGRKSSLLALTLLLSLGFLLMGQFVFYFSFLFAFLHQIVRGFREPIISDYINKIITSDRRSTILSVEHMVSSTVYAAVIPFIGLFTDTYTYTAAMSLMGVICLIAGSLTLILFYITKEAY